LGCDYGSASHRSHRQERACTHWLLSKTPHKRGKRPRQPKSGVIPPCSPEPLASGQSYERQAPKTSKAVPSRSHPNPKACHPPCGPEPQSWSKALCDGSGALCLHPVTSGAGRPKLRSATRERGGSEGSALRLFFPEQSASTETGVRGLNCLRARRGASSE